MAVIFVGLIVYPVAVIVTVYSHHFVAVIVYPVAVTVMVYGRHCCGRHCLFCGRHCHGLWPSLLWLLLSILRPSRSWFMAIIFVALIV